MKLVFIIDRQNTYHFFSTLINEGIRRKYEIELWHNYFDEYKPPLIENSPFYKVNYKKIKYKKVLTKEGISDLIRLSEGVDYFVHLNPVWFPLDKGLLKKINGKWCIIQHGHDSFSTVWGWQAFKFSGNLLQKYNRLFFVYSDFFYNDKISWLKRYSQSYGYGSRNYTFFTSKYTNIYPVGCTIYDKNILNIKKNEIYLKYKVPLEKSIFIYLPFIFQPSRAIYGKKGNYSWQAAFTSIYRNTDTLRESAKNFKIKLFLFELIKKIVYFFKMLADKEARMWILNEWNEEAVLKSIKSFCEANNMVLIIKSKPQTAVPYNGRKYADIIVNDDGHQVYPSKLQELISISSITLGYHTTAVTESVIGEVHHINLECPDSNLAYNEARLENHHTREKSKNNFHGIVTNMKIPEFIEKFPSKDINEFSADKLARESYMDKYTGKTCISSVESFYKVLEGVK